MVLITKRSWVTNFKLIEHMVNCSLEYLPMLKIYICCLIACFFSLNLIAQADKQLNNYDDANPSNTYYTFGNISLTTNSSIFYEGGTSLQIDYTIPAGVGNMVEILHNHDTLTKDISFYPDQLSIQIQGSPGNHDLFRFWLYEDLDRNGTYDNGDEIYFFDAPSSFLSNSGFQLLHMPYSSFVLWSNIAGGNSTLDLNRIRAFRITIHNNSATQASNQTIYADDLRQSTTYSMPNSGSALLDGVFIQLWNTAVCQCGQWTQAEWNTAFQEMKNVNMNKVIVQFGVYEDVAWYQPSSLAYVNSDNPTIERILNAANSQSMDVVLGLYFHSDWNTSDKSLPSTYSNLLTKQEEVIDEIWSLFASNSAFAGWYIPQEINDLEWKTSGNQNLLFNWLKDVSDYAKGKDVSKTVSIAPFFGPYLPADVVETWYNTLLAVATNIDVIYPQDGVGTTRTDADVDVPQYYQTIKNACDANGVTFGATIENFEQTNGWPINNNPFSAISASIDRFKLQIWEADQYTTDIIAFSRYYMQPILNQTLFDDYNTYASNILPIELLHFEAKRDADQVLLEWATEFEWNNDFFTIERSQNGIEFIEIGKVNSFGNSNRQRNYFFEDQHPKNGINYYRIKQTDLDGKFSYSNVISLNYLLFPFEFQFYPNPIKNQELLRITYSSKSSDYQTLKIFHPNGQLRNEYLISSIKGINQMNLSVKDFSAGIYFIVLEKNHQKYFKKLLVTQ